MRNAKPELSEKPGDRLRYCGGGGGKGAWNGPLLGEGRSRNIIRDRNNIR